MTLFADLPLARRLERAEAAGNASFVEARARLQPAVGAAWAEVAGAFAMFDGPDSPVTQTFGLGVFADPTDADLSRIEGFFAERGAPTSHELSPLVPMTLPGRLADRGYRPIELSTVLVRPLDDAADATAEGLVVRPTGPEEGERWTRTTIEGWSEFPEYEDYFKAIGPVMTSRSGAVCFLAEAEGRAIAAGALSLHEGVALLAGAATIPSARRRGAQNALLAARLAYAARHGADLAMMVAQPGSASQRNAERRGFRVAYSRTKWCLPLRT
ncbi:MAG: GNAT family N-acetyltransferase [Gemmatimonadales bacterium]